MREALPYLTAFLAALGESTAIVGLLVPGVGVVVAVSILAARGHASLFWVGALASLGSVAGFGLSYYAGRAGSARVRGWGKRTGAALARAEAFFRRYGAWSVFLGHFFGPVRAFVALAAGAADLDPLRFWAASTLGAIVWGFGFALAGKLLSGGWTLVEAVLGRGSVLLALLAVLLYVVLRIAAGALAFGLRLLPPATEATLRFLAGPDAAPWFRRIQKSHPAAVGWLRGRLRADHATGLLLTVGALSCGAFAWLFFGIVEDLLFRDPLVSVDRNVFHLLQAARTPASDRLFLALTYLGSTPVIVAAAGGTVLSLVLVGRRFLAGLLAGGFAAGEGLALALKWAVGRARPAPSVPAVLETTAAFPSNHAFSALVLYGFLGYLVGRALGSRAGQARAHAIAGVAILAIGVSRLYLGVHWLSDVAAGYALGGIWLTALVTAAEARSRFGRPEPPVSRGRAWAACLAVAGLVLAVWGGRSAYLLTQEPHQQLERTVRRTALPEELSALLAGTVQTLFGTDLGPLPLAVVGPEDELLAAFARRGWVRTEALEAARVLEAAARSVRGDPLLRAPAYPLFWRGAPQDLALARQEGNERRWVARLWRTGWTLAGLGDVFAVDVRLEKAAAGFPGIRMPGRRGRTGPAAAAGFAEVLLASTGFRRLPRAAAGGPDVLFWEP